MSEFDVILAMPYRFVDHPSFPEGILKRSLEAEGFRVGVIETPFWQEKQPFTALGRPRLCFAIVSGPVDSLVLNYTSARKRRRQDLYQTGGQAYFPGRPPSIKFKIRPDRALIVFANRVREAFPKVPIVIGGIEAGQRQFSHFDFVQEKIRRSVMLDSRADLLVNGRGEKQMVAIARSLATGKASGELNLPGTSRVVAAGEVDHACLVELPPGGEVEHRPELILELQIRLEKALAEGKGIFQRQQDRLVVRFPPESYRADDLDRIYDMDYQRRHPAGDMEATPALLMNLFSVTSHVGCGGGCSFCALAGHEGRTVISRSKESLLREIHRLTSHPRWKGVVSDIGGPSAEMYGADCDQGGCGRDSCLVPDRCRRFPGLDRFRDLLASARAVPGVKKVFLGSGVRYDLMLKDPALLEEIMRFHCGRFLRIAPEHTETRVLGMMRKPDFAVLEEFTSLFFSIDRRLSRPIELAPYLIVGHPGETLADVREMKKKLRRLRLARSDVQIFTPSPGTLATAMYVAEKSPQGESIPVEKNVRELLRRKALLTEE